MGRGDNDIKGSLGLAWKFYDIHWGLNRLKPHIILGLNALQPTGQEKRKLVDCNNNISQDPPSVTFLHKLASFLLVWWIFLDVRNDLTDSFLITVNHNRLY